MICICLHSISALYPCQVEKQTFQSGLYPTTCVIACLPAIKPFKTRQKRRKHGKQSKAHTSTLLLTSNPCVAAPRLRLMLSLIHTSQKTLHKPLEENKVQVNPPSYINYKHLGFEGWIGSCMFRCKN